MNSCLVLLFDFEEIFLMVHLLDVSRITNSPLGEETDYWIYVMLCLPNLY